MDHQASEVLRKAAPAGEASLSANCDGSPSPGSIEAESGYGRHCLLMAACCDLEARAEEMRVLAYLAWPDCRGTADEDTSKATIAAHRENANTYRETAEAYRRNAREAGEKVAAPCMSGFIAAVGGRP